MSVNANVTVPLGSGAPLGAARSGVALMEPDLSSLLSVNPYVAPVEGSGGAGSW
jgi:hypothetical protein